MQPSTPKKLPIVFGPAGFTPLPSAVYKARLINVRDDIGKFKNNPIFVFLFQITEGPRKGSTVEKWVNQTEVRKNGAIWLIVKALTGTDYGVAQGLDDLRSLIGKECYINVEQTGKNNKIAQVIRPSNLEDS